MKTKYLILCHYHIWEYSNLCKDSYYLPYFWNSHSRLSKGQTCRVFNHRKMQWKWNAWLQIPHATVQSSDVADPDAWHSIHKSIIWLRQMAQLSTSISHAHNATAFHFNISNFAFLFFFSGLFTLTLLLLLLILLLLLSFCFDSLLLLFMVGWKGFVWTKTQKSSSQKII